MGRSLIEVVRVIRKRTDSETASEPEDRKSAATFVRHLRKGAADKRPNALRVYHDLLKRSGAPKSADRARAKLSQESLRDTMAELRALLAGESSDEG